MTTPARSHQHHTVQVSLQTVAVVAVGVTTVLALGLLTAGSVTHHAGLLTWAMVCGMAALDLAILLAMKRMFDDAVRRCADLVAEDMEAAVQRTAIQVGTAIAAALKAEQDAEDDTVRLYS